MRSHGSNDNKPNKLLLPKCIYIISQKETIMLTAKQINARITKAVKSAATSRVSIQDALFSCIGHLYAHGDVSLLNRLFAEMPKGVQMEKLRQYALATAPIRMNKADVQAEKGLFAFKAVKGEADIQAKQSMLLHCVWYDYKPANSDKPKADVTTASIFSNTLQSMVKRLQEHTDLNDLEIAALNALKEAVASRQA